MNGWTDEPLSERGRREAVLLRERLVAERPPAAIYTSPLVRARVVADSLLAGGLGPPTSDGDLMEIGCGELDGWDVERVRLEYPILWRRNEAQADERFRWPGGESYREFRARCLGAIDRILRAHPGERIVVVTHAGVVSQILGDIAGTNPARWDLFRPGNASITTVACLARERHLVAFDDRAHLEGQHRASGTR
jgi:alpha-ribazole phosphatase/probable phosphoglycerate mutase